jgi:hypothetical protein
MNPIDLGRATAPAIHDLPSKFMLDGATYVRGAELGFEGMDFYAAGRGGVLGDVTADVVAAAFVFFEPGLVREAWKRSEKVAARLDAAAAFAECGYTWARANLPDDVTVQQVASLGMKVVDGTSPAGAPVFAAWRGLPRPDDTPALALYALNALRELRLAYHGAAVLTAGLSPVEAMAVKSPAMAPIFGWNDPMPRAALYQEQWDGAELATDLTMGRALAVLDDDEAEAFLGACAALHHSLNNPG